MKSIFIGIEPVSLVDYDGKIACALFVGGCNFRCPFCHNSEIVLHAGEYECKTEEEIFDYLTERKRVLDAVVISGGEPTLYPQVYDFIKRVKAMGFLVKLDTNGTNLPMLKKLVDNNLIDYIAMDIKNSKQKYAKTVGLKELEIHQIEQTVDYIMQCGVDYEFRTTIVNELHDEADIIAIGEWLKDAKKYRLQHFDDKGANIAGGLSAVGKDTATHWVELLKKNITDVELRGY
ncbi:MAG: anaerobic ribonucleoside-triphosphate reductase activating protein [Clostridia bacterium]|nr:anaerobic ribonucleoside-triphosphate reductase activating protein [Clostridia bacterium]